MEDHIKSALRDLFRPEFLNRIDEIIIFNELTQEDLYLIVDLMLKTSCAISSSKGSPSRSPTPPSANWPSAVTIRKFGARPLRRLIQKTIEDELAERYFLGELAGKRKSKSRCATAGFTFLFEE